MERIKMTAFLALAIMALTSAESSSASGGGAGMPIRVNPDDYFTINFQTGWNLFSIPQGNNYGIATLSETNCNAGSIYFLDPLSQSYPKGAPMQVGTMLGWSKSYWFKAQRNCYVKFWGNAKYNEVDHAIYPGWNMVGSTYPGFAFEDVRNNCPITSGPYKFNTDAYKWEKVGTMHAGEGYFVKTSAECILKASTATTTPIPPKGFDLGIQDIVFNPANPKVGDAVQISVTLVNEGSAGGYLSSYGISFEGLDISGGTGSASKTSSSDYIGPGGFKTLYFSHNFNTAGSWKVAASISASGDVNNGNDYRSEILYVSATDTPKGQDVGISVAGLEQSNPSIGQPLTLKSKIYNFGNYGYPGELNGYAKTYALTIYYPSGRIQTIGPKNFVNDGTPMYISPGYSYDLTVPFTVDEIGNYKLKLVITTNPGDINPLNNEITHPIYIGSATPTPTTPPGCTYSGDGTYSRLGIGCTIKSNQGYLVHMKDISAFYPQRAMFDIMTGSGGLLRRIYLLQGESAVISEANNLQVSVYSIYEEKSYPTGLYAQVNVKSGPYNTPTPPAGLPDLVWTGGGAYDGYIGEKRELKFIIKNMGIGRSQATTLEISGVDFLDQPVSGFPIGEILPGGEYSGSGNFIVPDKPVIEFRMSIDPNNLVAESTETNNGGAYYYYPKGASTVGFELQLSDMIITPGTPKVNELVKITAIARNIGDTAGYLTNWGINYVEGTPASSSAMPRYPSVLLQPGQTYTVSFEKYFDKPGNWGITAEIGGDYKIGNNFVSASIYVSPSATPTPTPTPMPFSPLDYDILIKPNHWASPATISLFNPSDRWRFQGTQSGTQVTITGMEDSIDYDRDYDDLGFGTVMLSQSRIVVAITKCNSAAKNAIVFKWMGAGNKALEIEETGESVFGVAPEILLYPQCQGNVNSYRTIVVSDASSASPEPTAMP